VEVERIRVEVAYATSEKQVVLPLEVAAGTTLESAVRQSGILEQFEEIDLATAKVGVFAKAAKMDAVLNPGDRVEIYRPLIADPKEARKKRAAEGKQMKKGAGQ
jgi:hypothetical protein